MSLKHSDTGSIYSSRTTETGNFTVPSLPPGNYELTVEGPGFRKYVQSGIQVQLATTLRLDVTSWYLPSSAATRGGDGYRSKTKPS